MKRITLLILCAILYLGVNAQTYGNEIQAKKNDGTILKIKATAEYALKVWDSVNKVTLDAINTKLNSSIAVTGTFWQATQPVSGTVSITSNSPINVAQINGVTPLMGAGNGGTGSLRVNIATDQLVIPVSDNGGSLTVDGTVAISTTTIDTKSGTSPVNTMNSASANSGLNAAIAGLFDDTSPTSITENSFGFVRMSANHNLYQTIRDAAGNERGANVNASNELLVALSSVPSHAVTLASTTITGTVAVTKSGTWILDANSGVDIGDVTINNASGASAVNIQDGGNSITVDGTVAISTTTIDTKSTTAPVSTMNSSSANSGVNAANAAVFDDTSPTAITENSFGFVRMSANRNQYQTIRDAAGNERGVNVTASNEMLVSVNNASLVVTQSTSSNLKAQVDPLTVATWGLMVEDVGETAAANLMGVGTVRRDAPVSSAGTTGDNATLNTNSVGGLWTSEVATPDQSGYDKYYVVSGASTNAANIKATPGKIYGWYVFNANASARKIMFHNTAGTPTAGASTYFPLVIPAGSGANAFIPAGINFSTGIGITMVTGTADNDATGVAAGDLIITILYK